jgi:predicted dehydrogenase
VGIHLVFASGVKAEIEIGNILPSKVRCFEVHGNNGSYIYNDLAVDKFVYMSSEGVKEPIEISHEMPLTRVIQAFADVVRNHHVTHPSLKLGTLVVRALASCQQSLEIQKVAP